MQRLRVSHATTRRGLFKKSAHFRLRPPICPAISNPAALGTALLIEVVSEPSHLDVCGRIIAEQCVFNSSLLQLADEFLARSRLLIYGRLSGRVSFSARARSRK